jgi:hypothetical protein
MWIYCACDKILPDYFLKALAPGRENLVFAPFGLATNVAMLLEAAGGDTAKEILRALNISSDSLSDLRTGFKAYCDTFEVSTRIKQSFCLCVSYEIFQIYMYSPCVRSSHVSRKCYFRIHISVASFEV